MAKHNEIGKMGEEIAKKYLSEKGYRILETNWRFGKLEVDIIASFEKYLAIIEIKTRTSRYGNKEPYEYVDAAKQRRLVQAGNEYIRTHALDDSLLRFDVIGILFNSVLQEAIEIIHFENAFIPRLETH